MTSERRGAALPLRFTGDGREYFRIWIVNLLLTIVTVGIYSAWAKVRREKYFHQHTHLSNGNFDFHGAPLAILRGRLIALALLGLTQADFLGSVVTIGSWVLFLAVLPWLMQRSIIFRLANTSYEGIRPQFEGTLGQAYRIVGGFALLALALISVPALILVKQAGPLVVVMVPMVVVLLYPMLLANWRRYAINHSRFGRLSLWTNFRHRDFLAIYVAALALWFLIALPTIVLIAAVDRIVEMISEHGIDTQLLTRGVTLAGGLLAYGLASSISPYITARVQNLTWNGARVGPHAIVSELDALAYVRLQLKNLALMLVTLGLYRPFAAVATARRRIDAMALQPVGDFDKAIAETAKADDVAVGAEAMELLGFDISL